MSAKGAVLAALEEVGRSDERIKAWAHLDVDRALAEADSSDRAPAGPLSGLTVGVKDVFDTADQPTCYGTEIYAGHRPSADASAVALLRRAGAVCLGKTVTAELACSHPGPTTNPHRESRTPGGSSMGSAAAVAAGMVDLALGTQTAASVIRPASFCGILGFKPTYGVVSIAGVKLVAPSLDTVGWFARESRLLACVLEALTGRSRAGASRGAARVGLLRTDQWEACDADSRMAVTATVDRLCNAGARIDEIDMPEFLVGLSDDHGIVMSYEASRALAHEHRLHRGELSAEIVEMLDRGLAVDPGDYDAVKARTATARRRTGELFGRFDVLVTPAVLGEAPPSETTGDPRFGRIWTMLGLPTVAVPATVGHTGLPVGAQLVGPAGSDHRVLAIAGLLDGDRESAPS